jgi:hypothetical protein
VRPNGDGASELLAADGRAPITCGRRAARSFANRSVDSGAYDDDLSWQDNSVRARYRQQNPTAHRAGVRRPQISCTQVNGTIRPIAAVPAWAQREHQLKDIDNDGTWICSPARSSTGRPARTAAILRIA